MGLPTDIVERVGFRRSAVEINWIMVSHETPSQHAHRLCHPSLRSTRRVQYDLDRSVSALCPVNPTGCGSALAWLPPERLLLVGEGVGLALGCAVSPSMVGDAVILVAWEAVPGMVPQRRQVSMVPKDMAVRAAE